LRIIIFAAPLFAPLPTLSAPARLEQVESNAAVTPSDSSNSVFRTIRSYVLWQHERGTLHYDIMVTLILIFVFFSPRVISFNDKPALRNPHPSDVVVTSDAQGLVYEISAGAISAGDGRSLQDQFLHIVQPISGDVSILSYEKVTDRKGDVQSYKVHVRRK